MPHDRCDRLFVENKMFHQVAALNDVCLGRVSNLQYGDQSLFDVRGLYDLMRLRSPPLYPAFLPSELSRQRRT